MQEILQINGGSSDATTVAKGILESRNVSESSGPIQRGLLTLPAEVLVLICSYLPISSLAQLSLVQSILYAGIPSPSFFHSFVYITIPKLVCQSGVVWKNIYLDLYGNSTPDTEDVSWKRRLELAATHPFTASKSVRFVFPCEQYNRYRGIPF